MKNFRTPIARVRGLGAAKSGTQHWWRQRLTAIANVLLMIWLVASVTALAGADYPAIIAWVRNPVVTALLVLTLANLFYHMRLGLQVVIEDYVHHEGAKVASLIALTFISVGLGALSILSVLKVAFAG